MTEAQASELEQTVANSLNSTTIEWALNFRIVEILQANPSLTPLLMQILGKKLQKDSPVPVLLSLSLLEIVAKNRGIEACRYVDEQLTEAMVNLVKKREGWKYSLGRNLYKAFGEKSGGIDDGHRELWLQASDKVKEMLQLWADAFLLQEGQLRPIFNAYKKLKKEGYTFPDKPHGASAELCLIAGAEESPAFLAAGGGAPSTAAPPPTASGGYPASRGNSGDAAAAPPFTPAAPAAAPAAAPGLQRQRSGEGRGHEAELLDARTSLEELKKAKVDPETNAALLAELHLSACAARDKCTLQVQRHMEGHPQANFDEAHLQALIFIVESLNEVITSEEDEEERPAASTSATEERSSTAAASEVAAPVVDLFDLQEEGEAAAEESPAESSSPSAPLPPPPEEAPPDREQQELYDLILARYLQERENEAALASEEEDRALALRLSMEENGGGDFLPPYTQHVLTQPVMVACAQCRAVNQLAPPSQRATSSDLFVCCACGLTQGVPEELRAHPGRSEQQPPTRRVQHEARPARHAPPPRVISAPGTSELLIGGGASAASSAAPAGGGYEPPKLLGSTASGEPQSFEGGVGRDALLGAPPKHKSWSQKLHVPSLSSLGAGSLSSEKSKSLGDGDAPQSAYMAMDDEEEGSGLLGDSAAVASKSSTKASSFLPWGRKKKDEETREPLLERVKVDEEWELIRPPDQRPYWHNTKTQASQWQPPDIVAAGAGTSLLG